MTTYSTVGAQALTVEATCQYRSSAAQALRCADGQRSQARIIPGALQLYEYRVVSLTDGQYTSALNDYARDGWELVQVVPDIGVVAEKREGGGLPMPGLGGKLGAAASKLKDLEGSNEPAPGTITTTFLWVLRRPFDEDDLG